MSIQRAQYSTICAVLSLSCYGVSADVRLEEGIGIGHMRLGARVDEVVARRDLPWAGTEPRIFMGYAQTGLSERGHVAIASGPESFFIWISRIVLTLGYGDAIPLWGGRLIGRKNLPLTQETTYDEVVRVYGKPLMEIYSSPFSGDCAKMIKRPRVEKYAWDRGIPYVVHKIVNHKSNMYKVIHYPELKMHFYFCDGYLWKVEIGGFIKSLEGPGCS